MLESSVLFLLVGVLILAVVFIVYISLKGKMSPTLHREKYKKQWIEI